MIHNLKGEQMTTIQFENNENIAVTPEKLEITPTYLGPPPFLGRIHFMIVVLIPFVLTIGAILLVIQLDFPAWEYGRIQADQYGWSQVERLELAHETLTFIRSRKPVDVALTEMAAVKLPDGEAFLYNSRELEHMRDVKWWTDLFRTVFPFLLLLVVSGTAVIEVKDHKLLRDVALQGGWLTLILVGGTGCLMYSAWDFFFAKFHELMFPVGSYTFEWTDSLIRLFPPKFWIDFGAVIVGLVLLPAIFMAAAGEWMKARDSNGEEHSPAQKNSHASGKSQELQAEKSD